MPDKKIYLVGFMGSGKTTAARKLATLLGWTFIDLDFLIEQKAGRKIPEIFSTEGESYFRALETEILRSLSQEQIVVSTGGGAPCHDGNMDYMLGEGITIYLRLTPGQLKSRLLYSKTERPLIRGIDKDDLQDYIENKLGEREKFYSRARIIMEGDELDTDLLLQKIRSVSGG
ncbi:MAG TPA: shikimate kinase [Bacteroidales bacterium]|jgi:shikimate kinase|nr:shikimate kinase [Bacteroidales bacterium]